MTTLRAALMAPWGLIFFVVVEVCIFLPLYLVGIPLTWWTQGHAATKMVPSRLYPERQIVAYASPWLDWWIGNYEDGAKPVFDWWPVSKTALAWFLRNPVCNLRFTPGISTKPSPAQVRWIGNTKTVPPDGVPGWFLCWQGPFVGFRWQCASWGVWIGWKTTPIDSEGVRDDYRQFGIGTACQLLRF